jgi:hypothetical protein
VVLMMASGPLDRKATTATHDLVARAGSKR